MIDEYTLKYAIEVTNAHIQMYDGSTDGYTALIAVRDELIAKLRTIQ